MSMEVAAKELACRLGKPVQTLGSIVGRRFDAVGNGGAGVTDRTAAARHGEADGVVRGVCVALVVDAERGQAGAGLAVGIHQRV